MSTFLSAYGNVIALVLVNAILGIGIYLVLCVNRFSLAAGGLMGLGAYVSALATLQGDAPFPVALLAGVCVAALFALLVGLAVLRLEGDYFALATLAFTEIVRVITFNWDGVTGGALGLDGIPIETDLPVLAASLLAVLAAVSWLRRGRLGRILEATRQDEMPAQSLGIDVAAVRLGMFVLSGAVCGLAGGLAAHLNSFIGPNDFGLLRSLDAVSYAVLGGLGSALGAVLGAAVFTVLPEALRFSAQSREILMSLLLLIAVVMLPRGLLSVVPRPRPRTAPRPALVVREDRR